MGTLAGHLVPGLYLAVVGIWHLFAAINSYLKSPREYSARIWHPVAWLPGRAKHLELYAHIVLIPLAIAYEFLVTNNFEKLVRVSVPAFRVTDYQHVALLFIFWLFAAIVLIGDTTSLLPLPAEAYFLLSGVVFAMEWIVMVNEGQGLEGKCNSLLAGIAAVCAGTATLLSFHPKAFLADLLLCGAVFLQGLWMIQSGLSLYIEIFIPDGCHRLLDLPGGIDGSTRCDLEEAKTRALSLMDLAFIFHVTIAVVFSLAIFGLVARFQGYRRTGGYEPLSLDSDLNHVQLMPMPKQAQL
ncbi:hypothetical protein O6H91_06G033000 [Diphasiastrum complanatum]|uniref:Uncharacterized protein n=1 Tax=Diphasiastrum complanatum TaxID=34168 RepID=A0ACC2DC38_DIPCM|nr:hypothetical protein O6H91_06G033000 [Diphasiastrum complanatum]